jgi:hypothetical protein
MLQQTFADKVYRFHAATGRYRWRKGSEMRVLHRDVYSDTYGNIPRGWHVHHRDGDVHNNAIENLRALAPLDHQREHPTRQRHKLVCQGCGSPFEAGQSYAKWCSPYCKGHARVPRRK